jgi:hypothetical protein
VFRHRWSLVVVLLGRPEGAILFALIHFLSRALIAWGLPAKYAGALVAAYGVSVLIWSRVANRLAGRLARIGMMGIGCAPMTAGHGAAAIHLGAYGIFAATVLPSGATAFLHSSLQVWSTEAEPELRGLVVACFACALFTVDAAVIQIVAPAAPAAEFAAAAYAWGAAAAAGLRRGTKKKTPGA